MKIRLKAKTTIENVEHEAGAVVEASEVVGRFLVRLHRAEEVRSAEKGHRSVENAGQGAEKGAEKGARRAPLPRKVNNGAHPDE